MLNLGRLRLVVAALVIAVTGAWMIGAGREEAAARLEESGAAARDVTPVLDPSPELTPEEVVTYQMTVLGKNARSATGIRQCYQFASPLNRAATGPLARFIRMVRSPPYRVMLQTAQTLVGRAVIRDDRATVLVTLIDPGRNVRVFRFFLSRQRESPYVGCWMTDAVREVVFDGPAPPPRGSAPRGGASGPAVGV